MAQGWQYTCGKESRFNVRVFLDDKAFTYCFQTPDTASESAAGVLTIFICCPHEAKRKAAMHPIIIEYLIIVSEYNLWIG